MKNFKDRRKIIEEKKRDEIKKEMVKEKIKKTKDVAVFLINKLKIILRSFQKEIQKFQSFLLNKFSSLNKILKCILEFCNNKLFISRKKIQKVFSNFYFVFLKNRYFFIGFGFLLFGFLNVNNQLSRFAKESIKDEVCKINFWPTLPFSNILMSRKMFELGYYEQSLDYYNKSKKLRKVLLLGSLNSDDFKENENVVLLPKKLESELLKINLIEEEFPYSWDLNLKKAELEYILSKKEELENSLALLEWLNPKKFQGFEKEFQNN